jgi:hypothetical protein
MCYGAAIFQNLVTDYIAAMRVVRVHSSANRLSGIGPDAIRKIVFYDWVTQYSIKGLTCKGEINISLSLINGIKSKTTTLRMGN